MAYADYTKEDKKLYFKESTGGLEEVKGVKYGGNYTLTDSQQKMLVGKKMTFEFKGVECGNTNQYLFYAKDVNAKEYKAFYDSRNLCNITISNLQKDTTVIGSYSFPSVNTFQIGYILLNGTNQQILTQSGKLKFAE